MEIIKKFNVNEYTSWILSRFSPHNAILIAEITDDIDEKKFKKAVELSCLFEDNLKLTISSSVCGFIACKRSVSINFDISHGSWQDVVNHELKIPFNDEEFLARIKIITIKKTKYILICLHHIICDGKSMINFLNKIIMSYNYNCGYFHMENKNVSDDHYLPFPTPKTIPLSGNYIRNYTKTSGVIIDKNDIKKIIHHSKKTQKSVNLLLSSMITLSFHESFNLSEAIVLHIPINLRSKDNIYYNKKLSFFTSWINIDIDLRKKDNFTFVINFIENQLKESIASEKHLDNLKSLAVRINNRRDDTEFANDFLSTTPALCVSNCGTIKLPICQENMTKMINVSEIHLAMNCQSYMGTKHSLVTIITSLYNEKTAIDVCYPFPLVSEKIITKFTQTLNEKIQKFIKNI